MPLAEQANLMYIYYCSYEAMFYGDPFGGFLASLPVGLSPRMQTHRTEITGD